FYSGNLQSHGYHAVFATAFVLGYAGTNKALWKRALVGMTTSSLLGFCLAAPVLLNQIEFFMVGNRGLGRPFSPVALLGGLASFSAVYPWGIGTFRTLDLSKFLDQGFHYGFLLFIGSAAFCLALLAAGKRGEL